MNEQIIYKCKACKAITDKPNKSKVDSETILLCPVCNRPDLEELKND